jgi:6-phosphogluconate dehydrogenase
MEIGFVGLGRMGFNMTLRLLQGGHKVVAWNRSADKTQEAARHGAVAAASVPDLV